jgi:TonB-dependent receptor
LGNGYGEPPAEKVNEINFIYFKTMKKNLQKIRNKLFLFSRYVLVGFLLQTVMLHGLMAEDANGQDLYEVAIQLKANNQTISEIFAMIERKTDFTFTYNPEKVDVSQRISISEQETSLGKILDKISQNTTLRFRQLNKTLIVKSVARSTSQPVDAVGTVSGIVTDGQTNAALPGATVQIAGTNTGTVTNLSGEFSLRATAGEIELVISYVGFSTVKQTVNVPADGVATVEVKMNIDIKELAGVVVTGSLQGQQRALNQQKSADNIKNVVSADQIGRFPDTNVAEALQRVPAINIERDQGEGRYVLVRGLAPQFTNISINGEQIPSPEAGVRYVALDAIPADQLSSIEVSKSLTPDMDGDAIGGSVNLITRTAQANTTTIRATSVLGYNQLVGRPNLQGSLEVGKRFFNNKLGIMLNSSYYETDRGSDNWERDDSELELRDYELVRTRLGLSSTIDYKFNDKSEIYFRSIYNRFTDREFRRRYILIPNEKNSPFEVPEIERLTKDRLEKQIVSSYNLGGKHFFSKFNLDYEVAYAEGIQDTPYDIEVGSIGEFDDIAINFTSNPTFPTFTVNGLGNRNPTNPYLNNANYEFDEFVSGKTYALDVNKTAKVNVGIPYKMGENDGLLKFGGKVRLKEKKYDITENVYGWAGGDVVFPGFEAGDYTLNKFAGGPGGSILDGRYLIQPNADVAKVMDHFNRNQSGYELDVDAKLATEAVEAYNAKEDVYAGYAMTKLQMTRLMVLAGLRYEKTNVKYNSKEVFYDFQGDLDEIVPIQGGTDYGFLLPQLQLKYRLRDDVNLRFAATRSYARPNFESIIPAQEIDLNSRSGSIGNAALKPVSATNIDFLFEKYFGTVGILSGGFFYKNLTNFIFNRRFETDNYNGRNFGTEIQLRQAQNGGTANLFGFEVAYQQNLTFLPGVLNGMNVYANYTYTHSNADIQSRANIQGTESVRLPGQAQNVGNFSLGYDKGRFNVRISSNFNGQYITEIGSDASEDLYVKDRMQLDATATFTLRPKLRLFTEFLNITNQPFEVFQGNQDQYIQREFYSWWTRVGLKFDF